MPTCPRCQQLIPSQAICCLHCGEVLKAYGHPGIPLHQARGDTFLCDSCLYQEDDTCTFPQRPYAKTCTLYHDRSQPLVPANLPVSAPNIQRRIQAWFQQNFYLLLFLGLIALSILLAL